MVVDTSGTHGPAPVQTAAVANPSVSRATEVLLDEILYMVAPIFRFRAKKKAQIEFNEQLDLRLDSFLAPVNWPVLGRTLIQF
jgi:hypothetical protein